jgi:hypothetical protein
MPPIEFLSSGFAIVGLHLIVYALFALLCWRLFPNSEE